MTELRDKQASYANTMDCQETKWRHSGRSRWKTVMELVVA